MDLSLLGWRDLILLLVVVVAIYMVVMVLKLARLRPSRSAFTTSEAKAPQAPKVPKMPKAPEIDLLLEPQTSISPTPSISPEAAMSAYVEAMAGAAPPSAEKFAAPVAPTFEWDDVKDLFGAAGMGMSPPAQQAPARHERSGFGESLATHLARSDMEAEMQRLRDEMARMQKEMEELRASQRVSPQYAEAMELSQRGLSAQEVADRLGISLAEAELVQALSRGKQNFD